MGCLRRLTAVANGCMMRAHVVEGRHALQEEGRRSHHAAAADLGNERIEGSALLN
jgi:hypothetical protein